MDWEFLVQASIGLFMITWPVDPVKILFFNSVIGEDDARRTPSAIKVSLYVGIILGGAAAVGGAVLQLMGINLGAFSVVGGLVVAGMGFEMLYSGGPSRAQGKKVEEEGPTDDSGLFLPLSIPLIAGPGAITTAITLSASKGATTEALAATLIGVAVVMVAVFVSFVFLGGALSKVSDKAMQILMRIGGMLLATIGVQMLLGGLRTFYGF
jgi:multiple antibiotic resistance protein